jgi:hypothetical protein
LLSGEGGGAAGVLKPAVVVSAEQQTHAACCGCPTTTTPARTEVGCGCGGLLALSVWLKAYRRLGPVPKSAYVPAVVAEAA